MGSKAKSLDTATLAKVARAALDNADALFIEANLLAAAGRLARAYALGVLAAEEYGKFHRTVMMTFANYGEATWRKYWDNFRNHQAKLAMFEGQHVDMTDWGPVGTSGDGEWLEAWNSRESVAKAGNRDKMSAFYVDIEGTNVVSPLDSVTQEEVEALFEKVGRVLGSALETWSGDLTERLTFTAEHRDLMTRYVNARTPEAKAHLLPEDLKDALRDISEAIDDHARSEALRRADAALRSALGFAGTDG